MAERQKFGYEQTLIYGQYTRELGSFAKYQAKRQKKKEAIENPVSKKYLNYRLWFYLEPITCFFGKGRDFVFQKIGEDWIFLTILGIVVALLSFFMDYVVEKCQAARFWLYGEVKFSVPLQYFAWVSYSLLLIVFATGFTHIVSPQAIGSGIPEMKTILRGVVLKEYLTFRTLVAKVIGLCACLSSTLPFGKEGPFVHIASMVATLLSKCSTSFRGIYENESRRNEMLAAACAVGVSCTYAAPIGGVLFSIEVTTTYFAVRNYWRGFYSAVCGAIVFRLMDFWIKDSETITAFFKTNLRTDFPYDTLELLSFSAMGVMCGFTGALFILMHRKVVLFLRQHKGLSKFLQKNRFLYPGGVCLLITSLTFPPGLGQFFAGELTNKQAITELFSNISWFEGQAENIEDETVLSHWRHPWTNVFVSLTMFTTLQFLFSVLTNSVPLPVGVFVPIFTIGAGFGRLCGECMAAWFPEGMPTGEVMRKIVPAGYAVVGAAAFAGSVTRTISTSVIVFELTGQMGHVLPCCISVLIANAVASFFQPSFYDSIIQIKRLPYLPDIQSSKAATWRMFVEDFMIHDVKFMAFNATYSDLQNLLVSSYHRSYPLVDNSNSKILLGSIQRLELERMLLVHLSPDSFVVVQPTGDDNMKKEDMSYAAVAPVNQDTLPRFQVTLVTEDSLSQQKSKTNQDDVNAAANNGVTDTQRLSPGPTRFLRVPSQVSIESTDTNSNINYNTVNEPLRSILKKSPSEMKLARSSSTGALKDDVHQFYRKLAKQRKESHVEDRPFVISSARSSFSSLGGKKVKLPPEALKVKQLTKEEQISWETAQLNMPVDWEGVQIDPAPFQLVERTSLHKVHSLFSLLGLGHAFVTNTGRLVGVVSLKEVRLAVQGQIDLLAAAKGAQKKESKAGRRKKSKSKAEDDNEDIEITLPELNTDPAPHHEYSMQDNGNGDWSRDQRGDNQDTAA